MVARRLRRTEGAGWQVNNRVRRDMHAPNCARSEGELAPTDSDLRIAFS